MQKEYVSVFNAKLARKLLKEGFLIVDIKPLKENKEKTIFIFKRTDEIIKVINDNSVNFYK